MPLVFREGVLVPGSVTEAHKINGVKLPIILS